MGNNNPVATTYYGGRTLGAGAKIVGNHADRIDPSVGVTPLRRRSECLGAMLQGVGEGLSPSYMWKYWTGQAKGR